MKIAAVNFQFPVNGAPQFVVRDHPADRAFDEQLGMPRSAGSGVLGFVAADEPGEAHKAFLFFLLTGQPHLFRVNDDDEIAGIDVGGVDRLFFAAEEIGGLHGDLAEHLVIGVNDPPLAWDFVGFGRKRLHQGESARKLRACLEGVNCFLDGVGVSGERDFDR